MYAYDNMYEVKSAIEIVNKGYDGYRPRPVYCRSKDRQWDYIIRRVCTGCGKPLNRYDTRKGHAYCLQCRQNLFPETVNPYEFYSHRFRHRRS